MQKKIDFLKSDLSYNPFSYMNNEICQKNLSEFHSTV